MNREATVELLGVEWTLGYYSEPQHLQLNDVRIGDGEDLCDAITEKFFLKLEEALINQLDVA